MFIRPSYTVIIAWICVTAVSCTQPRQPQTPPAERYVAAAQCAACHAKIAQSYSRTSMANSLQAVSAKNAPAGSFYHAASGSTFTMEQRNGRFYQRRHETGFEGKQANVMEKEIHYVMGSGHHVRTYLHRGTDGKLVELPLAWYAEKGGTWAMNPGYDRPDHQGFRRAISDGCLFCHNSYSVDGKLQQGIDCQRCHGPGAKHVQVAQTAGAKPEQIRAAIINPTRLSTDRQMEVCMQCHLETTSFPLPNAIVRFERDTFSYKPGEPLGDYSLYFDHAPGAGREDKFEIVNAAYRLRRSACFLKSNGRMTCTTCHNPHESGAKPNCQQCHSPPHAQKGDCAGCHMPRRRTEDVVHAVVTDHFIQRNKPSRDLLAPLQERHENDRTAYRGEVRLYYPQAPAAQDELYVALAQVIQKSNLEAGIPQLAVAIEKHKPAAPEFYLHLGDAYRNQGVLDRAIASYEEALRRRPGHEAALLQLGAALRLAHHAERAAETLQRVPRGAYELGLALLDQKKVQEAIPAFQQALQLDAEMPEAHNSLGGAWFVSGESGKAEAAFREAIRIRPDYAEAHNNLGGLLAARNDLPQACYHYEAAIKFQPHYVAARYNYGLALARMQRFQPAREQIEVVLRAEPNHAEAHQVLAAIFANQGRRDDALLHYREALRIRPGFGRALIGLASELARSGNFEEAASLLGRAMADADAGIRRQAEQMLSQLQRR